MTTVVPSRGMRGPEPVSGEHPRGMQAMLLRSILYLPYRRSK